MSDPTTPVLVALLAKRFKALREQVNAIRAERPAKGDPGPPGPRGPKPEHQWRGTKLRFEKADGRWGKWVDLQGPDGGMVVVSGGGATRTASAVVRINLDGGRADSTYGGIAAIDGGGA